jgi:phage repressor protein C with HTH and peptisase S24 domain
MLKERMAKVFAESGERTQAAFAASVGLDLDRLKNMLGGRVARLKPEEARAIQQKHGWREVWLLDGKGAQRLTREEQALLSGENAPLPALRHATEMLTSRGVIDPRTVEFTQQLYLAAARSDTTALDKALGSFLDSMRDGELDSDYVKVPRHAVTASAGHGAVITDESVVDHLAFRRTWIAQSLGVDPTHLALIDARGDSMSPTIESGDLLLLDTRNGGAKSEGIYVINLAGALLVKRLRIKLSGSVEVMSDNPKYSSETISGSELDRLLLVGRVVWHGRKI